MFAGAVCSIGLWMLLQLLGTGIGLSAIDADDAGSLRTAGVGAGIWSLIAPLIAMFLGGLMAGKLSQTYDRKLAGAHGAVMWALTSVVGLWATISIASMLVSGAVRTGGMALNAAGSVASSVADRVDTGSTLNSLGIDSNELLGPVNQRLTAQGKPTVTASELSAAMRGVARGGVAHGGLNRELLVDQLAANTRLSRADASDVARQIENRWNALGSRAQGVAQDAQHAALGAADTTGKALTTVGVSLLLSLIASVLGAMLALHRPKDRGHGGGIGDRRRGVHRTEPGIAPADPVTTTSPYPTPMTGPATAVVPPGDLR